jgi:hypothetical protein
VQFAPLRFIYQIFNTFLWKSDTYTLWMMARSARRMGLNSDLGMNMGLGLGWEMANKPVEAAVVQIATLAGVGGGAAPGTVTTGVVANRGGGVMALLRSGSLQDQSKPDENKDQKDGKGMLKKKYASRGGGSE